MTLVNSLFLLLAGQGLFLAFLIYHQKKIKANPWVSFYFASFSLILISWVLIWQENVPVQYKYFSFAFPLKLLLGPFFYLSVFQKRANYWKHLIPGLMAILILIPYWINLFFTISLTAFYVENIRMIHLVMHNLGLGSIGFYLYVSRNRIKTTEHVLLSVGLATFLVGYIVYMVFTRLGLMTSAIDYILASIMSVSFYYAGYYYFYKFKPYAGRNQGDVLTGEVFQEIDEYLLHSKAYLDPEFQLNDLAVHLDKSKQVVSHTISSETGKNFKEFLNSYRIQHAKSLLVNSDAKILAVALDSGYKNKVSFIQNFKKFSKLTPHQYRIQHQTLAT